MNIAFLVFLEVCWPEAHWVTPCFGHPRLVLSSSCNTSFFWMWGYDLMVFGMVFGVMVVLFLALMCICSLWSLAPPLYTVSYFRLPLLGTMLVLPLLFVFFVFVSSWCCPVLSISWAYKSVSNSTYASFSAFPICVAASSPYSLTSCIVTYSFSLSFSHITIVTIVSIMSSTVSISYLWRSYALPTIVVTVLNHAWNSQFGRVFPLAMIILCDLGQYSVSISMTSISCGTYMISATSGSMSLITSLKWFSHTFLAAFMCLTS